MTEPLSDKNDFILQATLLVKKNITNDQFGVSDLAGAMGMSRSNLLRKIKKQTNLSASLFIREVRLEESRELLKQKAHTISEIAYKVGFSSPSYFIKCFRERYGYPPGDFSPEKIDKHEQIELKAKNRFFYSGLGIAALVLLAVSYFIFFRSGENQNNKVKSIAVLPFINDSNDSTNVYIINGLMESTLNNLQKIKDLRVISRTSVEKYRTDPKTTPEIAKELNATYLVEGSGQKIGNQILLNIQLIEASTDKNLWGKQYKSETKDIFKLQAELAKNIANEIKIIITPEEEKRIDELPTENLQAYDNFLKGYDLLRRNTPADIRKALPYFFKAIELDHTFARAYSAVAIAYYSLDAYHSEKKYSDSINFYADQALFYDPTLPQGLSAKGLFYMSHKEFELAIPYFEKALEYSPNNDVALLFLVDLYANYFSNTKKYLEYALKGLEVDLVASYDSVAASYAYLHISNAFIQSGFINEAEKFVNRSLNYLPDNLYSEYLKAYVLFAKSRDLNQLKKRLIITFEKDTNRLDVMQEVGKAHYYLREYEESYRYYSKFMIRKEELKLDFYSSEYGKIARVYAQVGKKEEGYKYIERLRAFAEQDRSINRHYNFMLYYCYKGETDKAMAHFKLFSEQDNHTYWTLLFTPLDPILDPIKDLPEFKKTLKIIETKFGNYHKEIKSYLKEKMVI